MFTLYPFVVVAVSLLVPLALVAVFYLARTNHSFTVATAQQLDKLQEAERVVEAYFEMRTARRQN